MSKLAVEKVIEKNYSRYITEPQERNERGQLTSKVAEIHETLMNRALERYYQLCKASGGLVLLERIEGD